MENLGTLFSFASLVGRPLIETQPLVRRLVTRLIGVIPAAIVAAAAGNSGLNTMLVASQVLLSIVLPTVIFPLVYLCSRIDIMSVDGPEVGTPAPRISPVVPCESDGEPPQPVRSRKTYRSPRSVTVLGYALFGIVVLANVYVIVELALGTT